MLENLKYSIVESYSTVQRKECRWTVKHIYTVYVHNLSMKSKGVFVGNLKPLSILFPSKMRVPKSG